METQSNRKNTMRVSVVIPCFNEEHNIGRCLESLVRQEYEGDFECLVVDNGSTDGSLEVIRPYRERRDPPEVRLEVEHRRGTAAVRDTGVRKARGDFIAFIDADCTAPESWLRRLVEAYGAIKTRQASVMAVGGRNLAPPDSGSFTKAVEIALDSFPGSFRSVQGRQLSKPKLVSSLSLVNALYEKKRILEVGGFDISLRDEAEDAELNHRLATGGAEFYFVPESFVWHRMRPTPRKWLRNMFRYGKGRARLLKRFPGMWDPVFLLPLMFALALVSMVLFPLSLHFLWPGLYFPLVLLFSLFLSVKKGTVRLWPYVWLVFVIQHIGYAAGEIYGLLHPGVK